MKKQIDLRERVYRFYEANRSQGKMYTIEHFQAEGEHQKTIRRIIDRFINGIDISHQRGAGRPAIKMPKRQVTSLLKYFDHKDKVSQRKASRKYNICQSYVNKILKTKSKIKKRIKRTIPKRTEHQKRMSRLRCSTLWRKTKDISIIMDDESYFTLSHSSINGNDIFYSSDSNLTPPKVKYKEKAKFEKKILVWIAASPKGLSEPYLVPSGMAINKEIYKTECIQRRLLPFINTNYSEDEYLLWSDLASSHYANNVLDFMRQNNINFVEKNENPANVPEVRPIENYFGYLKGKVYEDGWEAKNLDQLARKIRKCLKNIDLKVIQELFSNTRARLDKVRRYGLRGDKY